MNSESDLGLGPEEVFKATMTTLLAAQLAGIVTLFQQVQRADVLDRSSMASLDRALLLQRIDSRLEDAMGYV